MLSGQSSHLITIDASPESYEYFVGPFSGSAPESAKRQTITLEPGVFQIVAKVSDVGVNWYHGEITLDGDNLYTEWFYITSHF